MNRYRKDAAAAFRRLREMTRKYGTFRLYWDADKRTPGGSMLRAAAMSNSGRRYFTTTEGADLEWTDIARRPRKQQVPA